MPALHSKTRQTFHNFDFCPCENHSYGKVDATYIIRKSMGSMRSLSELIG